MTSPARAVEEYARTARRQAVMRVWSTAERPRADPWMVSGRPADVAAGRGRCGCHLGLRPWTAHLRRARPDPVADRNGRCRRPPASARPPVLLGSLLATFPRDVLYIDAGLPPERSDGRHRYAERQTRTRLERRAASVLGRCDVTLRGVAPDGPHGITWSPAVGVSRGTSLIVGQTVHSIDDRDTGPGDHGDGSRHRTTASLWATPTWSAAVRSPPTRYTLRGGCGTWHANLPWRRCRADPMRS